MTPPGRFLALGDSYTIGEGVAPEQAWPAQLARLAARRGAPAPSLQVIARTGWTTDELHAAIETADAQGPFDVVSLLVGVNDQYRGRSVTDYRPRFRALLARAVEFAGGRPERVIVVSIPDWGVTPFAAKEGRNPVRIAAEIDAFNTACRDEATAARVAWVDVTSASRRAGADPAMLVADGLHPSGAAYQEWARLILPVAAPFLVRSGDRAFPSSPTSP